MEVKKKIKERQTNKDTQSIQSIQRGGSIHNETARQATEGGHQRIIKRRNKRNETSTTQTYRRTRKSTQTDKTDRQARKQTEFPYQITKDHVLSEKKNQINLKM